MTGRGDIDAAPAISAIASPTDVAACSTRVNAPLWLVRQMDAPLPERGG